MPIKENPNSKYISILRRRTEEDIEQELERMYQHEPLDQLPGDDDNEPPISYEIDNIQND